MLQKIKCFFGFHKWVIDKNKADGFIQKTCSACDTWTSKITEEEYQAYFKSGLNVKE